MIREPQKWVTATTDNEPGAEWVPPGFVRVSAWEPFATAMVYYGLTGLSIGEAAINAVGSVVVWRCVVEPAGGAS
jgi:hypothetical protein